MGERKLGGEDRREKIVAEKKRVKMVKEDIGILNQHVLRLKKGAKGSSYMSY